MTCGNQVFHDVHFNGWRVDTSGFGKPTASSVPGCFVPFCFSLHFKITEFAQPEIDLFISHML